MSETFKLAEAYTELTARDRPLHTALARGHAALTAFSTRMDRTKAALAGLFSLPMLAGAGAALGLTAMVNAAVEGEAASNRLRAALRANNLEVEENAARMGKLADAMRDKLNLDDDLAHNMMAQAVNLGANAQQAEELTKAAVGLAEVLQSDVGSAMDVLIRAGQGNFMMLERQLPALRALQTQEQKLAAVQQLVNRGLRQRAEMMGTSKDQLQAAKIAVGELGESLGKLLLPAAVSVAQALRDVTRVFTAGTTDFEIMTLNVTKNLKSWEYVLGRLAGSDAGKMKALREEITALHEQISKVQNDATKKQVRDDADLTNAKVASLRKLAAEQKGYFHTVDGLWQEFQRRALEGEPFADAAALRAQEEAKAAERRRENVREVGRMLRGPMEVRNRAWWIRMRPQWEEEERQLREHPTPLTHGTVADYRKPRLEKLNDLIRTALVWEEWGTPARFRAQMWDVTQRQRIQGKHQAESDALNKREAADRAEIENRYAGLAQQYQGVRDEALKRSEARFGHEREVLRDRQGEEWDAHQKRVTDNYMRQKLLSEKETTASNQPVPVRTAYEAQLLQVLSGLLDQLRAGDGLR